MKSFDTGLINIPEKKDDVSARVHEWMYTITKSVNDHVRAIAELKRHVEIHSQFGRIIHDNESRLTALETTDEANGVRRLLDNATFKTLMERVATLEGKQESIITVMAPETRAKVMLHAAPSEPEKGAWICDKCGTEWVGGFWKRAVPNDQKHMCDKCKQQAVTWHPKPEKGHWECSECGKDWGDGRKLHEDGIDVLPDKSITYICLAYEGLGCGEEAVRWKADAPECEHDLVDDEGHPERVVCTKCGKAFYDLTEEYDAPETKLCRIRKLAEYYHEYMEHKSPWEEVIKIIDAPECEHRNIVTNEMTGIDYCADCGEEPMPDAPDKERVYCPRCHFEVYSDEAVCPRCGLRNWDID